MDNAASHTNDANRPPLFPSWNHWYALLLVVLAGLISWFYWLTGHYQ